MVATLTTHDTIAQPEPVHAPDGGDAKEIRLSEIARRPAS
jgi:hypothetical protein